jgi:hypothetical protein
MPQISIWLPDELAGRLAGEENRSRAVREALARHYGGKVSLEEQITALRGDVDDHEMRLQKVEEIAEGSAYG